MTNSVGIWRLLDMTRSWQAHLCFWPHVVMTTLSTVATIIILKMLGFFNFKYRGSHFAFMASLKTTLRQFIKWTRLYQTEKRKRLSISNSI